MNRPYLLPNRYVFPEYPPELPYAKPENGKTEYVTRADVREVGENFIHLEGITQDDVRMDITISIAAVGVARVLLQETGKKQARVTLARSIDGPLTCSYERTGESEHALTASDIRVDIHTDPFKLTFTNASGVTLLEQNATHRDATDRLSLLPFGLTTIDGQRVAFHDSFSLAPDEHFYGFGEKFNNFDKRGLRMEMWAHNIYGMHNEQAYKNVPFFLSTRRYGLFVDSPTCTRFDMGSSNQAVFSMVVPDTALDYYVIAGPDYQSIISRYADLTGHPQELPKWAFGLWLSSSFGPDNETKTIERATKLRELDIPCDVIHLDCFWQKDGSWSDLEWDRDAFPDPEGLLRRLKAMGFKICLWENPYLSVKSPKFPLAQREGYLLKKTDGEDYVLDLWDGFQPQVGLIDFTNPAAVNWFKDAHRSLIRMGVEAFEPDFGESVPFDAVAHNGMTGETLHNLYPLLYNDAIRDVMLEESGRYLMWGRSSFTGGQRHAIQWGADCDASYQSMAGNLRGGLSIGLSGHPFWSHDIGGFTGDPTPDLYIRWAQFGLLSPISRPHGVTTRLPWAFGEEAQRIFREYTYLRYRLLPYLYSYGKIATATSLPMMRAMLLEFPDDPCTHHLELQYMLGSELMVAPIFNNSGKRSIYFPAGKWVDYWTHEVIQGSQTISVQAPIHQIPLYVRASALIPTIEPQPFTREEPFDFVTYAGYLLGQAQFTLYDLDGRTDVSAVVVENTLKIDMQGAKSTAGFCIFTLEGMPEISAVVFDGQNLTEQPALAMQKGSQAGWRKDEAGDILVNVQR